MKFKDLIWKFDNWNGNTRVNDDNLKTICEGLTSDVALRKELRELEVRSFGFYNGVFCVRLATE